MMETDILTDKFANEEFPGAQWQHPMYGNGKAKGLAFGKRKARADWMEKNHKKWFENFSWRVLAVHKLRCRVKSLAEEARMFRKEENRASLMYSESLRSHRIDTLRRNARYAQLALAFVRGRPYRDIENEYNKGVLVGRLALEIREYAPCVVANMEAEIFAWLTGKQS